MTLTLIGILTGFARGGETKTVLPENPTRIILGGTGIMGNNFLLATAEEHTPDETCIRIITCDNRGEIIKESTLFLQGIYFASTGLEEIPLLGIHSPPIGQPRGLWLGNYESNKLSPQFVLKEAPKEGSYLSKAWLLSQENQFKLYVEVIELKQSRIEGELHTENHWLYCYILKNDNLELESNDLVAEGKSESDEFSVECALVGNDVYVWVCEQGGMLSNGFFRVAKWQKMDN